MKIIENKPVYPKVLFGDLKPGDTFAVVKCNDDGDLSYAYLIKTYRTMPDSPFCAIDLQTGAPKEYDQNDLVIPIEFTIIAKWPTQYIKRK